MLPNCRRAQGKGDLHFKQNVHMNVQSKVHVYICNTKYQ